MMWALALIILALVALYVWMYVTDLREMKEMKQVSEPVKNIINDFKNNPQEWVRVLHDKWYRPTELVRKKDGSIVMKVVYSPISVYPEVMALPPEHINYRITILNSTQPITLSYADSEALYYELIRPLRLVKPSDDNLPSK